MTDETKDAEYVQSWLREIDLMRDQRIFRVRVLGEFPLTGGLRRSRPRRDAEMKAAREALEEM